MRQKLKIISKQTSFLEIGFFPSCICSRCFFPLLGPRSSPRWSNKANLELPSSSSHRASWKFSSKMPRVKKNELQTQREKRDRFGNHMRILALKIIMKHPFCWRYGRCHQHSLHLLASMNGLALLARGFPHDMIRFVGVTFPSMKFSNLGWVTNYRNLKKNDPKKKTFPYPHTSKMMIQIDERCRFFQRISWICENHVNTWRLALRLNNQLWFMFS